MRTLSLVLSVRIVLARRTVDGSDRRRHDRTTAEKFDLERDTLGGVAQCVEQIGWTTKRLPGHGEQNVPDQDSGGICRRSIGKRNDDEPRVVRQLLSRDGG